jgi:hypothetical protein
MERAATRRPEGADILLPVTTKRAIIVRRTAVLLAAAGSAAVGVAGPAAADVPEGWSNPEPVSVLHALLILAGLPALLFVLITIAVYVPSLVRGERVKPGPPAVENQWFGGPRKGTSELAEPDNEESKAGGASGRW